MSSDGDSTPSSRFKEDGWVFIENDEDYKILIDLIEVNNNVELPCSHEMESFLKKPPRKGTLLKLLWVKGEAVGFFIVRLKGVQEDSLVPIVTEMNILDAVFVRQSHRRQGWGSAMLNDIIKHFPDENVGFSHPISLSLQHGMKIFIIWFGLILFESIDFIKNPDT